MAQRAPELSDKLQEFILKQKMFFVATAGSEGRINLSPKGLDTLRILDKNRVVWLNLTGSGNETSVHVQENGRITMMFCAFEGGALILRLYGQARAIHSRNAEWQTLIDLFPPNVGARQIIDVSVDLVQSSCGTGVPLFDYVSDRDQLVRSAEMKGEDGIRAYWRERNQTSLDGKPTHIID